MWYGVGDLSLLNLPLHEGYMKVNVVAFLKAKEV
jgi:hypothetical protein